VVLYILFGAVFVGGIVGYWVVTRALRNPSEIYVAQAAATPAPHGNSPHLGKA
jgi:hypothetical protein